MLVKELEIFMFVSDEQSLKASLSILVTEFGMFMLVNDEQP